MYSTFCPLACVRHVVVPSGEWCRVLLMGGENDHVPILVLASLGIEMDSPYVMFYSTKQYYESCAMHKLQPVATERV